MITLHTCTDNKVELGDYAQVEEFDAEVVAVDRIAETCTLEFVNDQGNDEQVEIPFNWMNTQQQHELAVAFG